MKKALLTVISVLFIMMSASAPLTAEDPPDPVVTGIVQYEFTVEIISGFLEKEVYKGKFSYNASRMKGTGAESLEVTDISFTYRCDVYQRKSFDWIPKVKIQDGKFIDIEFVGGPQNKRFGLNVGFNRNQFGRESESFIREGQRYFGYLDPHTYVEGAGKVTYKKK